MFHEQSDQWLLCGIVLGGGLPLVVFSVATKWERAGVSHEQSFDGCLVQAGIHQQHEVPAVP